MNKQRLLKSMEQKPKKTKSSMEETYDKIQSGEFPIVAQDADFCFSCVQCGKCCRDREDILLNSMDVFRLCKTLNMQPTQFADKYCEKYVGRYSKMPMMRVDFRNVYDFDENIIGTRCPFLSNRNGLYFCRVHEGKPFVCYSYPLGRVVRERENVEFLFQADISCDGAKKAQSENINQNVTTWMGGAEKIDVDMEFYRLFSELLDNIRDWINLDKLAKWQNGNSIEYTAWLNIAAKLLYENFDIDKTEKEFIEQFKHNSVLMKTLCEEVVKSLDNKFNIKPKQRKKTA